jgi:predicted oxidoreductase
MSLVHNERTKLLANSLDRTSTACVVAGLIAPAAAIALHLLARRSLGGLQS